MHIFKKKVWSPIDIMFLKWSSVVFGAIIGAYAAGFVKQYVWIFIILVIALAIKPVYSYWFKD